MITPAHISAAIFLLLPFLFAAFFASGFQRSVRRLPHPARLLLPASLALAYLLVSVADHCFQWHWLLLYALLPPAIAALLTCSREQDPDQHGHVIDFLILLSLGLAVDLRWFEPAWPPHLSVFNKVLLLDAGIYGFHGIRELDGVGFDLRIRSSDLRIGGRELALYAPLAILLGLAVGFLHVHPQPRWLRAAPMALGFTFLLIAVPEELFFRGWLQNLLARRIGPVPALFFAATVFGLAHFNKRAAHFNWRYVLLAAIAGIFYGRAWRSQHRVAASALTHASVDTLWSLFLR